MMLRPSWIPPSSSVMRSPAPAPLADGAPAHVPQRLVARAGLVLQAALVVGPGAASIVFQERQQQVERGQPLLSVND